MITYDASALSTEHSVNQISEVSGGKFRGLHYAVARRVLKAFES